MKSIRGIAWAAAAVVFLLAAPAGAQCHSDAPPFCLNGHWWTPTLLKWYSTDNAAGMSAEHGVWLDAFNRWMAALNDSLLDGTGITGSDWHVKTYTADYGNNQHAGNTETRTRASGQPTEWVKASLNTYYTAGLPVEDRLQVAVHELGHTFGLDHFNGQSEVMEDTVISGLCGRIHCPTPGAVRGVHALYLFYHPHPAGREASAPAAGADRRPAVTRLLLTKTETFRSLDSLAAASQVVVRGVVLRRSALRQRRGFRDAAPGARGLDREDPPSLPVTDVHVRVREVIKGDPALRGRTLRVEQDGGAGAGRVVVAEGVPQLVPRTEYVLFLDRYVDGSGRTTDGYVVRGLDAGIFCVEGGRVFVPRVPAPRALELTPEQEAQLDALQPGVSRELAPPAPEPEPLVEDGRPLGDFLGAIRSATGKGGTS